MDKQKRLILIISAAVLFVGSLPFFGIGALILLAIVIGIILIVRKQKKKKIAQVPPMATEAVDNKPFEKYYKQIEPTKQQPTGSNAPSAEQTPNRNDVQNHRIHCPYCGAFTIPKNGFCEYCDSRLL